MKERQVLQLLVKITRKVALWESASRSSYWNRDSIILLGLVVM